MKNNGKIICIILCIIYAILGLIALDCGLVGCAFFAAFCIFVMLGIMSSENGAKPKDVKPKKGGDK